jgi:RNA polymerase sigma factor (sigma-70 family)
MARHKGPVEIDVSTPDATLATQTTAGSLLAFEELYRRHAQAAWRVAQAVTRNREDAADAVSEAFTKVLKSVAAGRLTEAQRFRSYLLTTTRNAALDVHRRTGRVRPEGEAHVFDGPAALGATAADAVTDDIDHRLVLSAFDSLPERWRSVLWLTEVEGIPAREAAGMLGVSANGVAQLAVRARAGLRERFLQAHLSKAEVDDGCRFTVERLGAYVAGALAPRDLAKVDQHLAGCESCRARKEELEDLGSTLRRIVLPFPLGLAALTLGKWKAAAAVGGAATGTAASVGRSANQWLLKAQRPLAAASVALFAAGIVGVGVVGQAGVTPRDSRGRSYGTDSVAAPPTVTFTPASSTSDGSGFGDSEAGSGRGRGFSETSRSGNGFGDDGTGSGDSGSGGTGGGSGGSDGNGSFGIDNPGPTVTTPPLTTPTTNTTTTSPPPTTPPTTAPPTPLVQAGIHVQTDGTTVSVGVGAVDGSQTGVSVTGTDPVLDPPPPPDDDDGVSTETGGTLLEDPTGAGGLSFLI